MIAVAIGKAGRTFDSWMSSPRQAVFSPQQPQDVGLSTDVIDSTELWMIGDKRCVLHPIQHPINRLRKETDPMPSKMHIGFLARKQQKLWIAEPLAFGM